MRYLLLLLFCLPLNAFATTILDPGPQGQSPSGFFLIPFNDLNGTPLSGQSLSLDFIFADSKYIFSQQAQASGPWLQLVTDHQFPAGNNGIVGTASALDAQGVALYTVPFGPAGTGPTDTLRGIFFPNVTGPIGYHGAHYEVTLPVIAGARIIGGNLNIVGSSWISVPEPPAVWMILTAGFAFCVFSGFHRLRKKLVSPPLEFPSVQL